MLDEAYTAEAYTAEPLKGFVYILKALSVGTIPLHGYCNASPASLPQKCLAVPVCALV